MPSFALLSLLLLMTVELREACLPMDDVFKASTLWMQPISVADRHLLVVGQDKEEKIIKIRTERDIIVATYTCLESHGQHRYMMNIMLPNQKSYFQCVKFTSLTPQVVRIASSSQNPFRDKLNCLQVKYMEEQAVLIAYYDIQRQPCPLQGGFQMLLREDSVEDECIRRGWNENPSINFECGPSNNVLVQFGKHCVPKVLTEAQKMRRRYLTHLTCVSSWEEADKGKFILLQMRDMYTVYWCLNYAYETDEILSVYLTFDGRCSKKSTETTAASRIGHLIRYVPHSDPRCSNSPGECYDFDNDCSKSNMCPHRCNRCLGEKKKPMCRFRLSTAGQWSTVRSRYELSVDVDTSNFTTSDQGEFECTDFEERSLPGKVYPVVQYGSSPSCLPYHACSQVVSPYPGLLNFFLRPAATENGRVTSCARTNELFGHIVRVKQEEEYTLLDESKLENRSCNFMQRKTYSTHLEKCRLAVEQCSGTCDTLEVGYDPDTCGNDTRYMMELETTHVCQTRIPFRGGHHGILTKSVPGGHFFCWIFINDNELRIARPHVCNSDQVFFIVEFYKDDYEYDPVFSLSIERSVSASSGGDGGSYGGSYASQLLPNLKCFLSQLVFTLLCVIFFVKM